MKTLLIFTAVAALILIVIAYAKAKSQAGPAIWPYRPRTILTLPEQTTYHRIKEALPEMEVLAQVGLSRVLETTAKQERKKWFWKISQKSVDFAICLKDFTTVAIVELDDSSHSRSSRKQSDADKDKAITDAGLTILRWNVKNIPSVDEIRKAITSDHQNPSV